MIRKPTIKGMYVIAFAMIVGGFIIKMLIYKYTNSQDTYSASYNRLDQFGYGILLFLLLNIRQWRPKEYFWIPSAIMIAILIYLDIILSNKYYSKVIFQTALSVPFFWLLASLYYQQFNSLKFIKWIAQYSYNLYLWHPIMATIFLYFTGFNLFGILGYSALSLLIGIFTTNYIEKPALIFRDKILEK